MKILDNIRSWWAKRRNDVVTDLSLTGFGSLSMAERMNFASVIFYNICDLLTDISAAVEFRYKGGDLQLFAGFKTFFDSWGKYVLNALFKNGFVVIGRRKGDTWFWVLDPSEYTQNTTNAGLLKIYPNRDDVEIYVMSSQTMKLEGKSDREMLQPFLRYLDNVLNGSNTVSERMGTLVVMSPQQASGVPVSTILTEKDKERIEKEIGGNDSKYGYLRNQKSMLLLPNAMNIQTINLAGMDNRMQEKVRTAILAICDRIKVPANQVAIIDANSSKTLANGTELREGDLSKYRNFRRLLNVTFYQMAIDLGLDVDYIIENEPIEKV
ncbi:MAG: hypothetical protein IIX13_09535 [Bacteroidales bacterium]|nr:hypothetical protein [Bacteroidales bacterium]